MRGFFVRLLISIAIGAGFVYLAFRGLSWTKLQAAFGRADYVWIIPFFGTLVGVQFFRAWRWRFLLQPVAPELPSTWRILVVSTVGFGAITLLPLRLGEFVRPYLIAGPSEDGDESKRLRVSAALGTIAVERVIDGLLVSLFLFVTFLFLHERPGAPGWMMPVAYTAISIFGGATLFLAAALWRPRFAIRVALTVSLLGPLARRYGGIFERVRARVDSMLEGLISGFASLKSAGALAKFLGASLVYWFLNGLGMYFLAKAFHLGMPLIMAYALCGLIAIGIVLPAGPGLVGNFHEFGRFGLALYLPQAVLLADGMAFIVLLHGLQVLWYVGMAALATLSRHGSFGLLRKARARAEAT